MMQFTTSKKYQLEAFICDWHWDKESHQFATELGTFLLGFMDYLVQSGGSDRVYRTHKSNLWSVGILTCQYGYHKKFLPGIFKRPPFHEYEFKRKTSDTVYALKSYSATCNQLSTYAAKHLYNSVEFVDMGLADQIEDFIVGLQLFETRSGRFPQNDGLDFKQEIKMIQKSCVHALSDVKDGGLVLASKRECVENLDKIALKLASFPPSDHYCKSKTHGNLLLDVRELKRHILENGAGV